MTVEDGIAVTDVSSTPLTEDGARPMTNKEQRLARKAEKEALQKRKANAEGADNGENDREKNDEEEEEREEEEVEAMSHKEMRKRRKLEKQAANRTGDAEPTSGERTPKEPQRSPFSLWIGNLSFQTSPQRLQEWLEEGSISGITRIHMPKGVRRMEYNRGFAYVDVPSAEMMKEGVKLSEGHLDGRRLLIKSGSDFGGRPSIDAAARALAEGDMAAVEEEEGDGAGGNDGEQNEQRKGKTGLTKTAQKILRAQKNAPAPTLFIGNLSFGATEEGVREMIERSATLRSESGERAAAENALRGAGIRKIRMGTFQDTGKCKGFGFVDFHSPAYATATLIDSRNHQLDGRTLVVQYAGADAIRRGAVKGKGGEGERTTRRPPPRRYEEARQSAAERQALVDSAPVPGSFDPDAPLIKKHKETKEEREERRRGRGESTTTMNVYGKGKRVKPGAALATAQRGKTAIDTDAPQANKITFNDDE